jgi:predicted AlkP superfamily phosphohydrolase/phosphomutase
VGYNRSPYCKGIKDIINNGTRAVLRSTMILASNSVWTSFATGCDIDKHGIVDFYHREKGAYESTPFTSRDRRRETLWHILSRENKKVGVLNVPGTYPVEKVNGFMVSGFPTPEELDDFTYPKELLPELRKELGRDFRFQPKIPIQEEAPFLEEVRVITDYVYRATEYLMNNYEWDFLITVFMGLDEIGHAYWKYMDPKHPLYDDDASKEYKNAIYDIYRTIDKKVAALKKNVDSDTTVLLMSDHGFGPLYYGVSFNNWLLSEGLLTLKKQTTTNMRYWLFRRGVNYNNLLRLARALKFTGRLSQAADSPKSFIVRMVNKFFLTNDDIDWTKTKAYCMGSMGQLFINLKGREPQGVVGQGKEYDELVDQIVSKLTELTNPGNGDIIFDEIHKKMEAYKTSRIEDDIPDILFFDRNMKYQINRYFLFGSKDLISPTQMWSGTHIHDGIFMAFGDNQVKGNNQIEKISICDITPTVLHIMGLPVSKDIDGRVLSEIFNKESEAYTRDIEFQSPLPSEELKLVKKGIGELKKRGKL